MKARSLADLKPSVDLCSQPFYEYTSEATINSLFEGTSIADASTVFMRKAAGLASVTYEGRQQTISLGPNALALLNEWRAAYHDDVVTMYHGTNEMAAKSIVEYGFHPSHTDDFQFGLGVYMTTSFTHALAYGEVVLELSVYRASAVCSRSGETYSCHQPAMIFPTMMYTQVITKRRGRVRQGLKRLTHLASGCFPSGDSFFPKRRSDS